MKGITKNCVRCHARLTEKDRARRRVHCSKCTRHFVSAGAAEHRKKIAEGVQQIAGDYLLTLEKLPQAPETFEEFDRLTGG